MEVLAEIIKLFGTPNEEELAKMGSPVKVLKIPKLDKLDLKDVK
jgi:hypothetical protein